MQLRDFIHVRQFLTHDVSISYALYTMPVSVVGWIFVKNFHDISKFNLYKLQCVQNGVAKIYHAQVNTPVKLLALRNWLTVEYHSV